jgi:uncharacterized protein YfiM (DUF2279 family)
LSFLGLWLSGEAVRKSWTSPNQALHLSAAAMLVSRGMKVPQAAAAGELGR